MKCLLFRLGVLFTQINVRKFIENLKEFSHTHQKTMDGKLHVVDTGSGDVKWHVELNKDWFPRTHHDDDQKIDLTFLPGPYDGSIYTYHKNRLSKLPLTIPQMVERSPSRNGIDNSIYIGDKKDSYFVIDRHTGQVKRKITNKEEPNLGFVDIPSFYDDIYVGFTDYTLTIFDSKLGLKTFIQKTRQSTLHARF